MTIYDTKKIQLFEHQTVRVGEVINGLCFDEATFKSLAQFQEKQATKYFSLVFNGIKLSHYVGVIQVGKLTIEILPKADKSSIGGAKKWQPILIEMLRYCRLLKVESAGRGQVQIRANSILDLYYHQFLNEVNRLIVKGLPKKYITKQSNEKVLKGHLDLPKHLRKNGRHPERFHVKYAEFSYDHLFNQVLREALTALSQIPLKHDLSFLLKSILARFPKLSNRSIRDKDFTQLFQTKKYQPHQHLLEISRLILLNFSPDIKHGQHHLFALLFDMNKLFEEYVFRQLKTLEKESISVRVSRQTAKPFWQRRLIRPDLVLQFQNKKYILDTKWKILTSNTPAMEDLKQIYIYCQYFDAQHGVLLYPNVHPIKHNPAIPFHHFDAAGHPITGQVLFLPILNKQGQLNKNLGADLLKLLAQT